MSRECHPSEAPKWVEIRNLAAAKLSKQGDLLLDSHDNIIVEDVAEQDLRD